jgi:hypothetical protein
LVPSLAAALPLASAAGLMSGISFAVLVLLFGNLLRRSRLQQPNSVPADGGDLLGGEDTDTKAAGRKREGTRGWLLRGAHPWPTIGWRFEGLAPVADLAP